uniref:cytochrome c oxidase subunit III n=1 Tax=Eoneureclipsis hainanensis TaxID=3043990 RepID=UPI002551FAB1|nr:cytochrome c oxidase subunit III [Eoneureclipsis hainanensis]WGT74387.1 cytochrome c oxidase subunit III [Eoneureclipsis hainanensis]
MNNYNHPYHLVNYSPWPLTSALGTMIMMMGMIKWFHFNFNTIMIMGIIIILISMFQWWRDIVRESTYQGLHTPQVALNMRWGMILFIISEIFFFLSFFWAFFHSSLSPNIEIGMNWPPQNINPFNPFKIPLLNTLILLSSGISVTWTHHSLLNNNYNKTNFSLLITILLGIYFTMIQLFEYNEASFSMADSIYGTTFFLTTGFHGLHVLIGTLFLMTCLMRQIKLQFSSNHHFGFEAAAWYWHFVDVVWLFLFIFMYWWAK